jgi:hypothetical protein
MDADRASGAFEAHCELFDNLEAEGYKITLKYLTKPA